jgi:hypothetical protein
MEFHKAHRGSQGLRRPFQFLLVRDEISLSVCSGMESLSSSSPGLIMMSIDPLFC